MPTASIFRHLPAMAVLAAVGLTACDGQFTGIDDGRLRPDARANDHGGAPTGLEYRISWEEGGTQVTHVVAPIESAGTVEDFYAWDAADGDARSANTGHEVSDAGTVLLHRSTADGHVSLVIIYDAAADGSGGSSRVHLYGFSGGHPFPVRDDPGSVDGDDTYMRSGTGIYTLSHEWGAADTDGFAVRDGLESPTARGIWLRSFTGLSSFRWVTADGDPIEVPFGSNTRIDLAVAEVTLDVSPPVITPSVSGELGEDDWYVSDIEIGWTVTDEQSPVTATAGCENRTVVEDTHGVTFTCEATSDGGTASASVTVKRDESLPVVDYSGDTGPFALDDEVDIRCDAWDETSGVASTSCTDITGPAWSFGVGTTVVRASATDHAGNDGAGEVSFEVMADVAGVCALVREWVPHAGLADALCAKLEQSQRSGRGDAAAGQLGAFVRHVDALRGMWLSDDQADTLIELARGL
ncbi:MAG: hypothetical protein R3314_02810 [Longimicrobiales bacterium]|nr:hypothetical protein [Longimicrobiales bacterium]